MRNKKSDGTKTSVWVWTGSGWVAHGQPRSTAARARDVAAILGAHGWVCQASDTQPVLPAPDGSRAVPAAIAQASPADFAAADAAATPKIVMATIV